MSDIICDCGHPVEDHNKYFGCAAASKDDPECLCACTKEPRDFDSADTIAAFLASHPEQK
jgi:hypothetical protein